MKPTSFDQAAGFYEQTRGFPPGVGEVVAEAAADLIGPARRVLLSGHDWRPDDHTGAELQRRW